MKVFLGGTVNNSTWREYIKPRLTIDYFDPVVKEWTEEAYQRELYERKICDFCLYFLTPKMIGFYSIAEVTDDSFKRPDRTIFCYITEDEGIKFDEHQLKSIERLGKLVIQNGAIWLKTIDEVIAFLNSAKYRIETVITDETFYNNVFISYGRKHSIAFARKLHDRLKAQGYSVWFDQNDIPLAADFQEQIDQGIEKADNFVFIISPHSVKSEYCLKEIILAIKYGKRIIPILHIDPADCFDKMHPVIQKINWIMCREKEDFSIPNDKWTQIDNFEQKFKDLINIIESQKEYVRNHSIILHKALHWYKNQQQDSFLLTGKDRIEAEKWLLTKKITDSSGKPVQLPCTLTDLHCEYITESKKNAEYQMTDIFISYSQISKEIQLNLIKSLARYNISSWVYFRDIPNGVDLDEAIKTGIEQADSYIYMITNEAIASEQSRKELNFALNRNKKILPVLIEKVNQNELPDEIKNLQFIDFTDNQEQISLESLQQLDREERIQKDVELRKNKSDYEKDIDNIVNHVYTDKHYHELHKQILVQALKWEKLNFIPSLLLRGTALDDAEAWLKIAETRDIHKPIDIQIKFIHESIKKRAELTTEVYICFSENDSDFAQKLNNELKQQSKTTWLTNKLNNADTKNVKEITTLNIETSENFLFILSPESIIDTDCIIELELARRRSKRIIALQYKECNIENSKLDFSSIQIIDFMPDSIEFQSAFAGLLKLLDFDKEHIQNLNKWLQKAIEWGTNKKDKSKLLQGNDLIAARNWLKTAEEKKKKPSPNRIHQEYIETSRKVAIQYRIRVITISVILVFVSTLAVFAFLQMNKALKLQRYAEKTKESLRLMSLSTANLQNEPGVSFALAYKAFQLDSNDITTTVFTMYSDKLLFKTIGKHKNIVRAIAVSPDNKYVLSASYDNLICLWDLYGNLIHTYKGHKNEVRNVAFSPDGKLFASAGFDSTVRIWSIDHGEQTIIKHKCEKIYSVCFSPDGKSILSGAEDKKAHLFDLQGNLIKDFSGHYGKIYSAVFSNDGTKILTGSDDRTLLLWNIDGTVVRSFLGHQTYISSVGFSPDGKTIISSSGDNTVCLWNTEGVKTLTINGIDEKILTNKGNYEKEEIIQATFSPDGKYILVCYKFATNPYLYDKFGTLINTFSGHVKPLYSAIFSSDGKFMVTCSQDMTVKLWNIAGKLFQTFKTHSAEVTTGNVSGDGLSILTCSNDNTIHLTDIQTKKTVVFKDSAVSAVLSKDKKLILSGCVNKKANIWNIDSNKIILTIPHDTVVVSVCFSSDEQFILTGCWNNKAYLWNRKGEKIQTFEGHKAEITSVEFSPDGKYVLTGSRDATAKLWSIDGKCIQTFQDNTSQVNSASFSPDGKYIVTANDDNTAKLWNISGEKIRNFESHKEEVWVVFFSQDGKNILTGSKDNTAKLWTIKGELIQTFSGHVKDVLDVDFTPDGKKILTASEDGTAILWDIQIPYKEFINNGIWTNLSDELLRTSKIKLKTTKNKEK